MEDIWLSHCNSLHTTLVYIWASADYTLERKMVPGSLLFNTGDTTSQYVGVILVCTTILLVRSEQDRALARVMKCCEIETFF